MLSKDYVLFLNKYNYQTVIYYIQIYMSGIYSES